jgi:hypothetical protein
LFDLSSQETSGTFLGPQRVQLIGKTPAEKTNSTRKNQVKLITYVDRLSGGGFRELDCLLREPLAGVFGGAHLLPLSGLFMSMIYPTLNSKGISCFPKTEHGAIAGVILFFTCAAVALGQLAMGAVSDAFGHPKYGFVLATVFAAPLFAGLMLNWMYKPAGERLVKLESSEYQAAGSKPFSGRPEL